MASQVSFTVRRPSPVSRSDSGVDSDSGTFKIPALPRHLTNDSSVPGSPLSQSAASSPKRKAYDDDSSDEEDEPTDELVTGFDKFGVQRLHEKKKASGPLVIPAMQNRDWRELARKRKTVGQYVPASAAALTGADGSVGGLGTRDSINSGPVKVGLQTSSKRIKIESTSDDLKSESDMAVDVKMEAEEETDDQRALRALLGGDDAETQGPQIDIIPQQRTTETDAFRQDIEELPEESTLDDYERVPVSQFGAALLRGMGWKEGTAASRTRKGPVEPYIPAMRPALLGIGAKEREALDDGAPRKKNVLKPERRYVPVVRKERDGERERSDRDDRPSSSRRASRSPSRNRDDRRHTDDDYRERRYERHDRDSSRRSDSDRDRDHNRHKDGHRERRDRDERREKDRHRDSQRERDYDYRGEREDRYRR